MTAWPKQSAAEMNKFFGNPDKNGDGAADAAWETANLTYISPPYPMFYGGNRVTRIRCHKKVAESLLRILTRIGEEIPEETIKRCGLDQFGGVYNFRSKRGTSASLSTHAYAAAIDLAAALNPWKVKYGSRQNMMPLEVVRIFQEEGWDWGGLWSNGDAMHFQAARTGVGQDLSVIGGPKAYKPSKELIEQVQKALIAKGYNEVGNPDGVIGSKTRGAVAAFEMDQGLPATGQVTADLWERIIAAPPREVAPERAEGKPENNAALKATTPISATGIGIVGTAALGLADPLVSQIEGGATLVFRIKQAFEPILDLWPILAVAAGGVLIYFAWRSRRAVVKDYQTGKLAR